LFCDDDGRKARKEVMGNRKEKEKVHRKARIEEELEFRF
jgi:hypothetical protein